jgi:hypothetical protein
LKITEEGDRHGSYNFDNFSKKKKLHPIKDTIIIDVARRTRSKVNNKNMYNYE